MSIDKSQLRQMIREVLKGIGQYSEPAEEILMGTAAQESALGTYFFQKGCGPALGIFQTEPATHDDIWKNYLAHKKLGSDIISFTGSTPESLALKYDLAYQIIMCRVHYLRCPEALPAVWDIKGMAKLWKLRYNTPAGKGTEAEFIANYAKYVG